MREVDDSPEPVVVVEMTGDANVRVGMHRYDHDESMEVELSPAGARRMAILLLEEAERADRLFERLNGSQ